MLLWSQIEGKRNGGNTYNYGRILLERKDMMQ